MNTIKINETNKITIRGGEPFAVSFSTTEHYTGISAIIDNMDLTILGEKDKFSKLYIGDNRNEITLYGDITSLVIDTELKDIISSITIESDTLTYLDCSQSGVSNINIIKAPSLKEVNCFGNNLYEMALDKLFVMLPNAPEDDECTIIVKSNEYSNPGLKDCDITLATDKGWRVMNYKSDDTLENTINPSVFSEKGKIHEGNYYDITTAIFEVVKNTEEIDTIMSIEPNHISYSYPRKYWTKDYDFDQILYYDEIYEVEKLQPTAEVPADAIGYAIKFGHDDEYSIDNPNILMYPSTPDYFAYVIKQGSFGSILCQPFGRNIQSKTWVNNGYVYRWAKFWGKLKSCYWTLNTPNYIDGNQDDFILAKCKLEDFKWNSNI